MIELVEYHLMSAHIRCALRKNEELIEDYCNNNPTHLHINFSKNYLKAFIIKQFNFVILLM